ncbi:hypothetical protein WN944_014048 [Citrus x changshan-huyou]|uniref:Uncharacterized protein n=1 Tax=Citrus x changshan-huyou TaxID=2935761 RepID=A0AAP0QPP5_9ROSI
MILDLNLDICAAVHGARNIGELQHYYGADQNMMTITSSTHDHDIPLGIADPRKPCCNITVRKCCRDDTTRSAAAAEAFVSTAPENP